MMPPTPPYARDASGASIPRNDDGPVFREPWEAQAFALALSLHERGLFTWNEWAATLGEEIKKAQAAGDPDTGETYYHHWLAALERIVADKGLADAQTLARTRDAWQQRLRAHAARRADRATARATSAIEGQSGGSVPSGTDGRVHAADVSDNCAACRTPRITPNGDWLLSSKSATSSREGSEQENPPSIRPRFEIHRPVVARETRTSQLPPSRAWRMRAMIAPNASK